MQTIAVFVAALAVATAVPTTVVNSQRYGGNFAYSTQETQGVALVNNVVRSPVATTYSVAGLNGVQYSSLSGVPVQTVNGVQYSAVNGLPVQTVNGVQYSSVNGLPVSTVNGVQYSTYNGVPVQTVNGVQYSSVNGLPVVSNGNVVYRTSDLSGVQNVVYPSASVYQSGTPASTVGVVPVSSVVV